MHIPHVCNDFSFISRQLPDTPRGNQLNSPSYEDQPERQPGSPIMKPPNIKLPHSVIVKSPGLLPMHYTIRELTQAVGAVERTLRDWLASGAPHLRDSKGHIWINGREFAGWVAAMRKPKRERKLKDSEGYCMRCRQIVELLEPRTQHMCGKLTSTRGKCARCGCSIHRGGRVSSNPLQPLHESKTGDHE